MLANKRSYATIPVSDLGRARQFYSETLGLAVDQDAEGGVMYRPGARRFFVHPSRYSAAGHTQVPWFVDGIKPEAVELKASGVRFEDFHVPGLVPVDGIAQSGSNVLTAWFKDPDGNLLGLTQIG